MLNFVPAPDNRVSADTGDLDEMLHAALSPLAGQQSNKAATISLIQHAHHTIDGSMFFSRNAIRMGLARLTGAFMSGMLCFVSHYCLSSWSIGACARFAYEDRPSFKIVKLFPADALAQSI
jgi:hypothetical protein